MRLDQSVPKWMIYASMVMMKDNRLEKKELSTKESKRQGRNKHYVYVKFWKFLFFKFFKFLNWYLWLVFSPIY